MKAHITDIFLIAISIVLACDLIYLYFAGAWHDPNKFIEYSEVALLFIYIVIATARLSMKFFETGRYIKGE